MRMARKNGAGWGGGRIGRPFAVAVLAAAFFVAPAFLPVGSSPEGAGLFAGKTLRCAWCGAKITGRYIKAGGKVYCSRACFEASLPKCEICGKPAKITTSDGKHYCSKECLAKTWPVCSFCGKRSSKGVWRGWDRRFLCAKCAKLPRCFACGMPGVFKLPDGRLLCRDCAKTAVLKREDMLAVAEATRQLMRVKLGLSTDHDVQYAMVDEKTLKKVSAGYGGGRELGVFRFEALIERTVVKRKDDGGKETSDSNERIKSRKYEILFLSGIPLAKLREVAGHELAHDWMEENYPHIRDVKLKEGWAEYVASQVNRLYGQERMNIRMERNKNPIYGDGYRYVKGIVEKGGIKALLEVFRKADEEGRRLEAAEKKRKDAER